MPEIPGPPTDDTEHRSSPPSDSVPVRPKGLAALAGVVTVLLVAAATLGVWAFRSAGDDGAASSASGASGGAGGMDHGDHAGHSGDAADSSGSSGDAAGGAHEGHDDGAVLDGCDADSLHASMMMFDPFVADGLLESGCTWPYSADIVTAGGTEDPSIEATFEPRRYDEVYDLLTAERLGMCAVSRLPDPTADGFVFGFRTMLHPGSCADGTATVQLDIREYATRPWRDAAVATTLAAADVSAVVVLGRWVITTSGDDTAAAAALSEAVAGIPGAATVSG